MLGWGENKEGGGGGGGGDKDSADKTIENCITLRP